MPAPSATPDRQPIRVIIAKPGLDGHDRGARVIAAQLRDAGFEVIYLGLRQTPESIVAAALQEDADVIGLSVHSGAHLTAFSGVQRLLDAEHAEHILLTGGGIIPEADRQTLAALGVGRLFGPGTRSEEIVAYLSNEVARRRARTAEQAPTDTP